MPNRSGRSSIGCRIPAHEGHEAPASLPSRRTTTGEVSISGRRIALVAAGLDIDTQPSEGWGIEVVAPNQKCSSTRETPSGRRRMWWSRLLGGACTKGSRDGPAGDLIVEFGRRRRESWVCLMRRLDAAVSKSALRRLLEILLGAASSAGLNPATGSAPHDLARFGRGVFRACAGAAAQSSARPSGGRSPCRADDRPHNAWGQTTPDRVRASPAGAAPDPLNPRRRGGGRLRSTPTSSRRPARRSATARRREFSRTNPTDASRRMRVRFISSCRVGRRQLVLERPPRRNAAIISTYCVLS